MQNEQSDNRFVKRCTLWWWSRDSLGLVVVQFWVVSPEYVKLVFKAVYTVGWHYLIWKTIPQFHYPICKLPTPHPQGVSGSDIWSSIGFYSDGDYSLVYRARFGGSNNFTSHAPVHQSWQFQGPRRASYGRWLTEAISFVARPCGIASWWQSTENREPKCSSVHDSVYRIMEQRLRSQKIVNWI
jgi:hypothetical protein